jgi:hypothetical protein
MDCEGNSTSQISLQVKHSTKIRVVLFGRNLKLISKFTWKCTGHRMGKAVLKEGTLGGLKDLDFI